MTDASSNRAAHYCLTPGGWVECSEEMCQRHSACVEKRNATRNRVDRCPAQTLSDASGAVVRCEREEGHAGNHETFAQRWRGDAT